MRFRFGIRHKIPILVLVLSLAIAYLVPEILAPKVRQLIERHEVVDLSEEGNLRAWAIIEQINQFMTDIYNSARNPELFEELIAQRKAAGGPLDAEAVCMALSQQDIKAENRSEEVDNMLASYRFPQPEFVLAVQVLPPDGNLVELFNHLGEGGEAVRQLAIDRLRKYRGGKIALSTITSCEVRNPGKPGRQAPVIWAAKRIEDPNVPDTLRHTLFFALEIDQPASPRHLTFLLDTNHQFVFYPGNDIPDSLREDTIFQSDPSKVGDGEKTFYQHYEDLVSSLPEQIREARRKGESEILQERVWEKVKLREPYYFLEGRPHPKFLNYIRITPEAVLRERLEELTDYFQAEGFVMGGIQGNVENVRLLGKSRAGMKEFKQKVDAKLREVFGAENYDGVNWGKTVACMNGDICPVIFPLDNGEGLERYAIFHMAFREELSYSVENELQGVRWLALLVALAAGGIAFLASLVLTRPLRDIADTAQSVTDSRTEALQNKIEKVRQSLPVSRRDETGEIARALERLLREVLNGHERLRQAQADTERTVEIRTQELAEANLDLAEAAEKMKGLAEAKDAFLASVSHELRQPLNSIFGFLQFLEMSDLDEDQQKDIGKIRQASTYLKDLINDILDYQKIILGGVNLEPEPIELNEFLPGVRDQMEVQAREKGNDLILEVPDNAGVIFNDHQRLKQVLVNLLSNACKFTENGTVTLSAERLHRTGTDWICFKVADTGRGMKPEEQANLFVKFKKLASREGNKSGTGLGLVITKGLVELMGGSITFDSEYGKGTTFTVLMPASDKTAAELPTMEVATGNGPKPRRGLPALSAEGEKPRILVVDDDANVRELMQRYLSAQGFEVHTAADGTEGIEQARTFKPAAITLDAVMPKPDGWDVLAELKSDPATAEIPVIMVTFLEDRVRGFSLGADDYIVKPIEWSHLSAILEKYVDPAELRQTILVIDDDASTREILRRFLEKAGWSVAEAANGAEGLKVLEKETPACILLDLMMPVMDGFDFIKEFRKHAAWQSTPVIVVTAKNPNATERNVLSSSVETVIQKGDFEHRDLLEEIATQVYRYAERTNGRKPVKKES